MAYPLLPHFSPFHNPRAIFKRRKRRSRPAVPLEFLEPRALLSAAIQVAANSHILVAGDTTPSALDFTDYGYMSTTHQEDMDMTRSYTITNTGNTVLTFGSIGSNVVLTGDTFDFLLQTDVASQIDPGSSQTFTIKFRPISAGPRHATVLLVTDDPNTPNFTFDLLGTGIATTNKPSGLQFATTGTGSGTIASTGSFLTVDYTGTLFDGRQFDTSLDEDPFNVVLGRGSVIDGWEEGLAGMQPGESRVLFIPGSLAYPGGNSGGQVTIPPNAPLVFTVTAIAVTDAGITVKGNNQVIAAGDSSPSASDFTDFGLASTTTSTHGTITRTFVISNTTSADLTITGIPTLTGADAADFSITSNPATTIFAGSSSSFTVSFSPQGTGQRNALVTIHSSDAGTPDFSFNVRGTGVTTVNSTTGLMAVTTTPGSGLAAETGSKIVLTFTGTLFSGPVFATVTDQNAPGTLTMGHPGVIAGLSQGLLGLQPGETRTLFIPSSLAYGSAGFGDVPPNTPVVYTVTAISVEAPAAAMSVTANGSTIANGDTTPSLLDFTDFGYQSTTPNASIGTITRLFQINGNGGLPLVLTGNPNLISITGANAGDFTVTTAPSSTIEAGTSSSFVITFVPQGAGVRTATVTIPSNDPDNPAYTFSIKGTGLTTTNATNGLMIATTQTGSGIGAYPGARLTVNYTGLLTTGKIFDSSDPAINPGRTPFQFALGVGDVIAGWDQGMAGIKPGETRILIIPGALAYPNGQGNIPAGAPLVFTVTGIAIAAPVISVVNGNGTVIAKGDNTPSTSDFTDFRQFTYTPENGTASALGFPSRTFYITDTGPGAIAFNGTPVTISGANAADFSVTEQPLPGAGLNEYSPFTITFVPRGAGKRTAVVTIHSTDPATPSYSFTIQGTGVKTINNTVSHLASAVLTNGNVTITGQSSVVLDYTGWLLNGDLFALRTENDGLQLQVTNGTITNSILGFGTTGGLTVVDTLIAGVTQGVQGIKAGETRLLVIPASLGFGATANGQIPANSTLVVTVTGQQRRIVVFANQTLIPFGGAPSADNKTLMGSIPAGSTATQLTQVYQLQGGGNDLNSLQLTNLAVPITGSGASAFKSSFIQFDTINGTHFVVTFSPKKPGTYTAVAHVQTNDPAHPDYQFTISATQTPWVELSGSSLGTISLPLGGSVTSGAAGVYNIPVTITNNGNAAVSGTSSAADFKVYLHPAGATSSASDILISSSSTTALRNLGAQKSKTITLPTTIPITVPAGDYTAVVKYNTAGAIPETNLSNNTATSSTVIHVTQGFNNLAASIGTLTLPAGGILSGSATKITLPVTITNNGNVPVNANAAPITFNIYLHNATGGTDTLIASTTSNSLRGLAVGKSAKLNLSTTVPTTIGDGIWQFLVKVNENSSLPETTLTDNNAQSPQIFNASQGFYDLAAAIGSTSFAANAPIISGAATQYKIPITITNTGNLPIASNAAPVSIKIFAHNVTSGTDTLILSTTTTALRNLGKGKSLKLTLSSALPISLTSGQFEFLVKVDDNGAIAESTLSNNNPLSSQTFSVTQGVHNIAGNLSTSTFATTIAHGTNISGKMTLTVRNDGNLTLPANQKISLQLVAIASDDTEIPIGAISSASLANYAPGKTTTISLSKSLANGLTAGTYLLAVRLAPTPSLTQNTEDDLLTQTAATTAFHLTVT
jgi:FKBP-type peptidyl-prolyl cis-trans isomerase